MTAQTREEIEAEYGRALDAAWAEYHRALGVSEATILRTTLALAELARAERERKLAELEVER